MLAAEQGIERHYDELLSRVAKICEISKGVPLQDKGDPQILEMINAEGRS